MTAVIFSATNCIEQIVIFLYIMIPPVNILPYPAFECFLHLTGFFFCKLCFLRVYFIMILAVHVLHAVTHDNIPLIQQILKNLVACHAAGAVGFRCRDRMILPGAFDLILTEFHARDRMKEGVALADLTEKPVIVLDLDPVCTDTDRYFVRFQVLWYH